MVHENYRSTSRSLFLAALCMVITIGSGCNKGQGGQTGDPSLSFRQIAWDFGAVDEASVNKCKFIFENTGRGNLTITSIKPECGCTTVSMPKAVYQPGETGVIDATVDMRGRSGVVSTAIMVLSNDPQRPVTRLNLSATVTRLIELSKPVLDFGTLDHGKTVRETISVRGRNKTFQIESVLSNSRYIQATIPDAGHNLVNNVYAREGTIQVTLDGNAPVGRMTGVIQMDIAEEKMNSIRLPVIARIRGDLNIEPCPAYFKVKKNGYAPSLESRITVASCSGKRFRLLKINKTGLDGIDNQITVDPNDNLAHSRFTLSISGTNVRVSGVIRGILEITTDNPEEPRLFVPIQGAYTK